MEKHPHGDVAHAVGLPLDLHIILLDARSRGKRGTVRGVISGAVEGACGGDVIPWPKEDRGQNQS